MTFLKQVINLWRIQKSNDPADKWVMTRLKVDPKTRGPVQEFHQGRIINHTCGDR